MMCATVHQCDPPPYYIQFGSTLRCLIPNIIYANPTFVSVFLSKVGLSDTYMHVWIYAKNISFLTFFYPSHPSDPEPLIGFRISLTVLYLEYAQLF